MLPRHGFQVVNSLGIDRISSQTYNLAKYFGSKLSALIHDNFNPVAEVYSKNFESMEHQVGNQINL